MLALHQLEIITVFAGLLCGMLIGLVAVGGVLMVPILHVFGGLPLRDAVAISMVGFLFTGLIGATSVNRDMVKGNSLFMLATSCLIGATSGVLVLGLLPATVLAWAVAGIIFLGVFDRMRTKWKPTAEPKALSDRSAVIFGLTAGFSSSISGTGGPLVLMPMFSWQGIPLRSAIALAQVLQLPIAGAATALNFQAGAIRPFETLLATVSLMIGMASGIFAGRKVPIPWLNHAVTLAMTVAGLVLICNSGLR